MTTAAVSKVGSRALPVSAARLPPRWRTALREREIGRAYALCLTLVVGLYAAVYGWLLGATHFLPYVMDNNETFSMLTHAANMLRFGIGMTAGLTDEVFGPAVAEHPFVYTHQGNFPRLFATLLYWLGATWPEAQITITTFTIGALGLFLAFHFFSRVASPWLALIVCAVFMSDYLFFAQWQVDTFRVWQVFFLFSSLLCMGQLVRRRSRRWFALTVVNFACLAYFELVFAVFVCALTAMYIAASHWRRPLHMIVAWGALAAGAVAGVSILLAQIGLHLGWDVMITDTYLTYVARNAASDPRLMQQVRDFYQSHNIAFWYDLVDTATYRTPTFLIDKWFQWVFQVYGPLFSLLVLVLSGGLSLAWGPQLTSQLTQGRASVVMRGGRLRASAILALVLTPAGRRLARATWNLAVLAVPLYLLLIAILRDLAVTGVSLSPEDQTWTTGGPRTLVAAAWVIVTCAALAKAVSGGWLRLADLSLGRTAAAGVFILAVRWFVTYQPSLYVQPAAPLWAGELLAFVPPLVAQVAVAVAVSLAVSLVVAGPHRVLGPEAERVVRAVTPYVGTACLAFIFTFLISPGYIMNGYLVRSAPFTVFITDPVIAATIFLVVAVAWRGVALSARRASVHSAALPGPRLPHSPAYTRTSSLALPVLAAAATSGLAVFMVAGWLQMQRVYLDLLPPTHYDWVHILASPPFRGASFTVNNYAAPVAIFTGDWAYYDPKFTGQVTLTDSGYQVQRDAETYLWFADRYSNPAYLRPDYFLCIPPQDLDTALARLTHPGGAAQVPCSPSAYVPSTPGAPTYLNDQVVAQDPSGNNEWLILKLDWDYPPYLQPTSSIGESYVDLQVTQTASNTEDVDVSYAYAQQDGVPEATSDVRLLLTSADGARACPLIEAAGQRHFRLQVPENALAYVRASVTPRTATKAGPEYLSPVAQIGAADGAATSDCNAVRVLSDDALAAAVDPDPAP